MGGYNALGWGTWNKTDSLFVLPCASFHYILSSFAQGSANPLNLMMLGGPFTNLFLFRVAFLRGVTIASNNATQLPTSFLSSGRGR